MLDCPVSVIIPCFRSASTIEASLDSILSQSMLPSEVLLIDDASDDDTPELIKKYQAKHPQLIRVVILTENIGPGGARNIGWDLARQPWIAFLDADDLWHPKKLELQFTWLTRHHNVDMCGHNSSIFCGEYISPINSLNFGSHQVSLNAILIKNAFPTRSVMLRSSLPFRFGAKDVAEDYLLWAEILGSRFVGYKLNCCLAYSLREEFSAGGYSGQLWAHEKRELNSLITLFRKKYISLPFVTLAMTWSFIKFLRRTLIARLFHDK